MTDLYMIDADGSNLVQLTENVEAYSLPAWSPDGRHVAFHAGITGKNEIYVIDADGSNLTRLTTGTEGLR